MYPSKGLPDFGVAHNVSTVVLQGNKSWGNLKKYLPRRDDTPKVNVSRMSPKTMANLTTFNRKPGNYNGTIIFEIDIMKKFSPINSKFTFLPLSKPK